ncbi:MAG: hypothetical protein AB1393_06085 [Candidatus Edwardsbacteria bacterium]
MSDKTKSTLDRIFSFVGFSIIISLVVMLVTYRRLYYGVDFTDEAFYVAMPYHFVLGGRPFIDEVNVLQTASFLTFPFIKLYYVLVGSTEGIILFTRHLYLIFMFLVALAVFITIKDILRWPVAFFISLICSYW